MTLTTNTSKGHAPDIVAFKPTEALPTALLFRAATLVTEELEGDGPVARVPWVDDAAAEFVAEGANIDESEPTLAEIVIPTGKVSQLVPISREQYEQDNTGSLVADSVARALIKRADRAFLAEPAPAAGQHTPPAGIITQATASIEEPITENLDPLIDAFEIIELLDRTPNLILASPSAWSVLRRMRTGTGENTTLLGAGTQDAEPRLLGVPVIVSPAVPAGQIVVADSTAIAAAAGPVQISHSEHVYFASDRIAIRATWRIGWGVQDLNGLVTIDVGGEQTGL